MNEKYSFNEKFSSHKWKEYFEENLKIKRVNRNQSANINEVEKQKIIRSLQAWQLWETSEWKNLLSAAKKYSEDIWDLEYLDSVKLFIKEEQKHWENLGKYLDLIWVKRLEKDLWDSLFRKVRYFNLDIEIRTITVIIVESAAQIYYKAIANSSSCKLLKEICNDILIDEAYHIKFQYERLETILNQRWRKKLRKIVYWIEFMIILLPIRILHYKAFNAGWVKLSFFVKMMYKKFININSKIF